MVRKYEVKIADYTHRTTNRAPGIITLQLASFSYFASKMPFVKIQNALVYSLADEIIDEEEFALLFDAYKSLNPAYPYWEYDTLVSTRLIQVNA